MTPDEIHEAYITNASYAEDSSLAKANAFVTACRRMLANPTSFAVDGESGSFDPKTIQTEMMQAQRWIAANARSGGAKYFSFRGLRD